MKNYLAIDIGGTYIKFANIDHSGGLQATQRIATPASLTELKKCLITIISANIQQIYGVGISCPGRVDPQKGVIYNGGALPFLHQFPLMEFVEQTFQIPCAVCNDGKSAALSELWLGRLKGHQNAAAIVLGTGVGGGIISNGQLLQGEHFQAGELSFIPRQSTSGATKDLIGFSGSAVQFIQQAAKCLNLKDQNDGQSVFKAINDGNEEVVLLFQKYCREIVHVILTLQAILDIEKIVIGGGISQQKRLIDQIRQVYTEVRKESEIVEATFPAVAIEACKFGNEANLLGAVYMLLLKIETITEGV